MLVMTSKIAHSRCLQMLTTQGKRPTARARCFFVVAVIGPRAYVPIEAISQKQVCSSHSTCEAEVVSMSLGLKETLPLLDFSESVQFLFRPVGTGAGKGPGHSGAGQKSASAAGGAENMPPRGTGRLAGADRFETSTLDSDRPNFTFFEDNVFTMTVIEKWSSPSLLT